MIRFLQVNRGIRDVHQLASPIKWNASLKLPTSPYETGAFLPESLGFFIYIINNIHTLIKIKPQDIVCVKP